MDGYVHPDFGRVTETLERVVLGRRRRPRRVPRGGAAVAVYHRGELVVDAWIGERRPGSTWTRDTMAMSFSTTKGVVATVAHRLADRGVLDYDEPVATYWPEFADAGKADITVRQILSHQAGMHAVAPLIESAEDFLDWERMTKLLAAASPVWEPGSRPGYHGISYGWLVGEVIRRLTGLTVEDAIQQEISQPLGLDGGLHIGAPAAVRDRVAPLIFDDKANDRMEKVFEVLGRFERYQPLLDALLVEDFFDVVDDGRVLDAEMPAVNGVFTARSLARMYAALATPDDFDGPPLVSADTLARATEIQTSERDAVVLFPMRWRLGYHLAATLSGVLPRGFGHFGFGGSGAWGDPESGLAVAMVLNRVAGTAFGDTRFLAIGAAARKCASRRED